MSSISRRQLRTIIFYEWKRGSSSSAATANIHNAFGEDIVTYRTVHNWFNRFQSGEMNLDDEERSGRPRTVYDDDILSCIKENPEATTRELALALNCTHPTIVHCLQGLGYRMVLSRWIPHLLTNDNKQCRVTICQSLLLQ